jgi:hypothetical protein
MRRHSVPSPELERPLPVPTETKSSVLAPVLEMFTRRARYSVATGRWHPARRPVPVIASREEDS